MVLRDFSKFHFEITNMLFSMVEAKKYCFLELCGHLSITPFQQVRTVITVVTRQNRKI
jgi:hypothetical protein